MTRLPLVAAAAFALIASGAAGAATPAAQPMAASQTPAAHASVHVGPVVDPDAMKSLNHHSLRAQLSQNLAEAGFTDVKIIPSSFYVRAKNKKGEPVAMVIGPDSFTAVTEVKTQATASEPKTSQGGMQKAKPSKG